MSDETKCGCSDDELELAWGVIANASRGNWERESPEWQEAAAKWRDSVMPGLSKRLSARAAADVSLMTILNAERYEMLREFYGDERIKRALARVQRQRALSTPPTPGHP